MLKWLRPKYRRVSLLYPFKKVKYKMKKSLNPKRMFHGRQKIRTSKMFPKTLFIPMKKIKIPKFILS